MGYGSLVMSKGKLSSWRFATAIGQRAQALVVPPASPVAAANRGQIATFAQKNRLASISAPTM